MKILKDRQGFTLIEMIIVVMIIAVLAAIAVPRLIGFQDEAKVTVLENNTSELQHLITAYATDYDKTRWHGAWDADDDLTLNNFLERNLEIIEAGHYANNSQYINPYSQKKSVLDYSATLGSGDGYRPAIFMTSNSSLCI